VRPLASLPDDAVHAVFPNGPSVYGRPNFIDGIIRDGLTGSGRAQGYSNDARRQLVDKGVQMLIYGKALQEFVAAKTRLETGQPNPNAAVDEAWAIIAGTPDNNLNRPNSILQTALSRENDFKLQGKLAEPMELTFVEALGLAQKGESAAFNSAFDRGKGYMNTIFYLGALRYAKVLEGDSTPEARQTHLAEGWMFFQTIRATVAGASPNAAQTVEGIYNRSANEPFPSSATTQVYAALNEPTVLQALGIPSNLVVRTPPQ
jgi:hypothetical protein